MPLAMARKRRTEFMWQAAEGLVGIMVVIFIFGVMSFPRSKKIRPFISEAGIPSKATTEFAMKSDKAIQQVATGKEQSAKDGFAEQKIRAPQGVS